MIGRRILADFHSDVSPHFRYRRFLNLAQLKTFQFPSILVNPQESECAGTMGEMRRAKGNWSWAGEKEAEECKVRDSF